MSTERFPERNQSKQKYEGKYYVFLQKSMIQVCVQADPGPGTKLIKGNRSVKIDISDFFQKSLKPEKRARKWEKIQSFK
jgi:hypothetical protein